MMCVALMKQVQDAGGDPGQSAEHGTAAPEGASMRMLEGWMLLAGSGALSNLLCSDASDRIKRGPVNQTMCAPRQAMV